MNVRGEATAVGALDGVKWENLMRWDVGSVTVVVSVLPTDMTITRLLLFTGRSEDAHKRSVEHELPLCWLEEAHQTFEEHVFRR